MDSAMGLLDAAFWGVDEVPTGAMGRLLKPPIIRSKNL